MLPITWAGEALHLLPDKAIHWPRRRALILADPHFGKSDHFRRAGLPVPTGSTRDNLARLDALLADTAAGRLIILGDLFHARPGVTPRILHALRQWRATHPTLHITVIAGNHDRHAGPPPSDLDIEYSTTPIHDAPFTLAHEPPAPGSAPPHAGPEWRAPASTEGPGSPTSSGPAPFTLAGHTHPAIRLTGLPGGPLRAPCFHFTPTVAVLPAFGAFTGTHTIRPRRGDQIYAIGPNQVIDVTPARHKPTPV